MQTGSMNKIFLLVLLVMIVFSTEAQSTRDVGTTAPPPVYQSTKQKKGFFARIFSKKQDTKKVTAEQQFEIRMKDVAKQKAKEARIAGKPEHSNKLYFGHKRKPKKRKPGKKKWCKICEFAH